MSSIPFAAMPAVSIRYFVKVSYQTSIKEINGNTKLNWYRILLRDRFLCGEMVLPGTRGGDYFYLILYVQEEYSLYKYGQVYLDTAVLIGFFLSKY